MSESSDLPLFHVVGFSGHRQLADPAATARAVAAALQELRQATQGEWIALSSVAEGADTIFVTQARALGLSWHAILPLPAAEFARDFAADAWAGARALLDTAEHVRVIMENGSREDAYLDAGMETVNGSDVLLAIWDGQPARGKGGTAQVINYARALERPLLLVDATTHEIRRENFEKLRRTDAALLRLNRLPGGPVDDRANPFRAPAAIAGFQQKCDRAATRGAPHFRRLIVTTVLLHVAATLVAAAALAFGWHQLLLPWFKFLCLIGALAVALVLRRHQHSHDSWVRCRLAAEFCRSSLATWGLPRAAPLFEGLDLPGVRGLTRALHVLHSRAAAGQTPQVEEFKQVYLERRIDDQLAYYRRQEGRALPLFRRLKTGFWLATWLAVACTLAYAATHTAGGEAPEAVTTIVFYFLPIALPVVAASLISLISINDLQRRVARYREMQVMLAENRQQVLFAQTWNSVEQVVLRTERALLQEVLEWHSLTSFAESH